jgi:hypothetical protein
MSALATYIMRGRTQAIIVAILCAVASVIFPPLSYLSGAVVALVVLRQGPQEGLFICLVSGAIFTLVTMVVFGNPLFGLSFVIVIWLPLWLVAMVLRQTVSLPNALYALALMGAVAVLMVFLFTGDPSAKWMPLLENQFREVMDQAGIKLGTPEGVQAMQVIARLMTGLMAAIFAMSLTVSLLIARWWQAQLYNPGGFRKEFHSLRLSRHYVAITGLVLVMAGVTEGLLAELATSVLVVLAVVALFPGIALVHGLVAKKGGNIIWLVLLYALLIIAMPQTVAVLAMVALLDAWLDFRGKTTPQAN